MTNTPTPDPAICFICARRHDNLGAAPTTRHQVKWCCLECIPLAKGAYHMPQRQLDEFERKALEAGGDNAGEYLDGIGKTDLAALEGYEWREFCKRMLFGYAASMREMFASGEAPF